jgi:hypothetical protein
MHTYIHTYMHNRRITISVEVYSSRSANIKIQCRTNSQSVLRRLTRNTTTARSTARPPITHVLNIFYYFCFFFFSFFFLISESRATTRDLRNLKKRACMVYFEPNSHKKPSYRVMYRTLYFLFCRDSGKPFIINSDNNSCIIIFHLLYYKNKLI